MADLFHGVGALSRALDYHLERHNVLASNVANVNTPGFQPMELVRTEARAHPQPSLTATDERHFSVACEGGSALELVASADRTVRAGLDGNSVSLERETAKIAANDVRYEGAVRIVSRQLAMLRYAANDGIGQ